MAQASAALARNCDLHGTDSEILNLPHKAVLEIVLRELEQRSAVRDALELHPLGFARVSFAEHRLADGYHLHMWGASPARSHAELPHSHAFDMQSRVLTGSLQQHVWDAIEDPDGDFTRVPVNSMQTGSDILRSAGRRVTLQSRSSRTILTGERYGMTDELHSTEIPAGTETITLIHKHYPKRRESSVIVPSTIFAQNDHFDHRCQDPDAVITLVHILLQKQLSQTA